MKHLTRPKWIQQVALFLLVLTVMWQAAPHLRTARSSEPVVETDYPIEWDSLAASAVFGLADIQWAVFHNSEGAIEALDLTLRLDPTYARAYNYRGVLYANEGAYEQSASDYTYAIELYPTVVRGYFNRARLDLSAGELESALENLNTALTLDPKHIESRTERAELFYALDQVEAAIADYEYILEIDPDNANAQIRLVQLREEGRPDQLIAAYQEMLTVQPDFYEVSFELALTYWDQGQLELALDQLNKLLLVEENRTNYAYYQVRGYVNRDLGRFNPAVADFTLAFQINPEDVFTLVHRGLAYEALGEYQIAVDDYKRALELWPDDHGWRDYVQGRLKALEAIVDQ